MKQQDLVTPYHEYFRMVPADTDDLRREVYRIRYNVYCADLHWEDPALYPDGEESDPYDLHSRHCLLQYRRDGSYIGCVRLVRANPDPAQDPIPLFEHCADILQPETVDITTLPRHSFGEISRLAIDRQFRRRPGEQDNPGGTGIDAPVIKQDERRRFPHIALGLYLGAASFGLEAGMSCVFAMMEPRLARLLKMAGIHFRQAGGVLEYRGLRAPFYITREALFDHLRPEMRELLDAIGEDLGMAG